MPLPESDGQSSDNIRASLSAAFDEAEKVENAEIPVQEPVETVEEPEKEPEIETEEQKAGRLAGRKRDEHGRLLPGKAEKELKVEETPKESKAKAEDKQPSEDTAKASEAQSITADAPPAGWTAEAKAEWSKLSPAIKAGVIKRESEIINGQRQWSEEKRRYESALSPVVQVAQGAGVAPDFVIQEWAAAHNALNRNAPAAIKALADKFGVNLATIAGHSTAPDQQVNNPDITAIVNQAVAQALGPIQERFAAEEAQKLQSTESLIDEFSAKNEHYKSVEDEIGLLIPMIWKSNPSLSKQQVLQEAYDRAVYANPHTRAAIQAAQNAEAEAKRRAEQQLKANKARTASTSLTGSSVIGAGADQPKDSLRAEIEAAFAQTG